MLIDLGMTNLLTDTSLNSEQQDYVHHITNSAESLLVLVTDILDFARLQVFSAQFKFLTKRQIN